MAPRTRQLRQTGKVPAGNATLSRAAAAATSRRPLSLLDLGSGPLERVLALLPQEDKLHRVPLVCKRLHQILGSGSPVVWESLSVEVQRKRPGREQALLAWCRGRTDVLRGMRLSIEGKGWMDTAAALLGTQGSLTELELFTCSLVPDLRESKGRTEGLLAALEPLTNMRNLCVMFGHSCPNMDRLQLPDLGGMTSLQDLAWKVGTQPPRGLEALAPSLTCLQAGSFTAQRWPRVLVHLTALRSLWLTAEGEYSMRPQDLGFLTALRGSLEFLVLWGTAVWPAGLPPALAACTRLTALQIAGSPFNMGEAAAAAAAPPGALPARGISAGQHMAGLEWLTGLRQLTLTWTMLRALPPQLTALTALTSVAMEGEAGMHISTAGELWGLLERLPALRSLGLSRVSVAALPPAEIASLAAAFPRVRLRGMVRYDAHDSDEEW